MENRVAYPAGKITYSVEEGASKEGDAHTLIAPGFAESSGGFRGVFQELSLVGYKTAALLSGHGIPSGKHMEGGIPNPQWRKADALSYVRKIEDMHAIQGIGHSEGAIALTGAALNEPSEYEHLVLYAPAGIVPMSIRSLMAGAYDERSQWGRIREQLRDNEDGEALALWRQADRDAWMHWASNPLQSLREIVGISQADIGDSLKRLQGDHGIKISMLLPENDRLMRHVDRIPDLSKRSGVAESDIHVLEDASHVVHAYDPEYFVEKVWRIFTNAKA
jgi:pimeloyl-ACP methyl ester carboxylesterase